MTLATDVIRAANLTLVGVDNLDEGMAQ